MNVGNIGIGRQAALFLAVIMGALLLSSGIAVATTVTCETAVDCLGTKGADTVEGTVGKDIMHARGGADTLKGFGNVDQLYGQGGKDALLGGPDTDYLIGGTDNDTLKGGPGVDRYYFGPGWGKDSIIDDVVAGTEIRFFSDILQGTPVTDDLTIDLGSGAGPEVTDESGKTTINWEGDVVDNVFSGVGDDTIVGNASDNLIIGHRGADTIYGGEGDDEIHANDGFSEDTVHCGGGDDTVLYDVGPLGVIRDQLAKDCEHSVANP